MKTEDFDRLKQICDENGFEFHVTDRDGEQLSIIVQKKDPWEGVEFFECGGEIIKLVSYDKQKKVLVVLNGSKFHETNCKPSTESAYFDQLKKEACERFGEIKVGDRFDLSKIDSGWDKNHKVNGNVFSYRKDRDALLVGDNFDFKVIIYQQGKWATKIEKVEVTKSINYHNIHTDEHHFAFHISKQIENASDVHSFITEQLTKYLNNERTT